MKFRDILTLHIQKFLGHLAMPIMGSIIILVLKWKFKYKMRDLTDIRKKYKQSRNQIKGPLLVCSNHLTMIDSIVIQWGFASVLHYSIFYKDFTWNLPAVENFKSTLWMSLVTYLGKCIPIDRKGSKEHHDMVMDKMSYLLKRGEPFTIFPEGERSRSGRVNPDNVKYGVGNILDQVDNCHVLCVYLRGDGQDTFGYFPKSGETFNIRMELIKPETTQNGLRAKRDLSNQVILKLKEMEDSYFAEREGV